MTNRVGNRRCCADSRVVTCQLSIPALKNTSTASYSNIDAVYCPKDNPNGPKNAPRKWYGFVKPIEGVEDIVNRAITTYKTFEQSDIQVIPVDCQTITDHLFINEYDHRPTDDIKLQTAYIGNGLDLA
jgi:hypothetical protein